MSLAAEVYAKELEPLGYGHPLWHPEPTSFGEIQIGDVGFVKGGSFYRLFCATRAAGHPANAGRRPPPDFTPLEYDEDEFLHLVSESHPPGPIVSSSSRNVEVLLGGSTHGVGGEYVFDFDGDRGAVAVLRDHATQCIVLENDQFYSYLRDNHESWYRFARARGHRLKREDIGLVSGWVKTSGWALAACTNSSRGHRFSLSAGISSIASGMVGFQLIRGSTRGIEHRDGPPRRQSAGTDSESATLLKDQCLFIRLLKAKKRPFSLKNSQNRTKGALRLMGKSGQSSQDSGKSTDATTMPASSRGGSAFCDTRYVAQEPDGGVDAVEGGEYDEEPTDCAYTPIDDLLDYILQKSDAEVAIAGHDDLHDICMEEWPDCFPSFFERVSPQITVDARGVGRIQRRHDKLHPTANGAQPRAPAYVPPKADVEPSGPHIDTTTFPDTDFERPNLGLTTPDFMSAEYKAHEDTTPEVPISQNETTPHNVAYAPWQWWNLAQDVFGRRATYPSSRHTNAKSTFALPSIFPLHRETPTASATLSRKPTSFFMKTDPDQYSGRVIAMAPLAHIVLFRSVMRMAVRIPPIGKLTISLGINTIPCAVAFDDWVQKKSDGGTPRTKWIGHRIYSMFDHANIYL